MSTGLGEPGQSVLADRLQQPELRRSAGRDLEQAVVAQLLEPEQHRSRGHLVAVVHRAGGGVVERAREDAKGREQVPRRLVEERVAPVQGGVQGLLASGQIAWSTGEQGHPVTQPGEQRRG